MGEGMECWRWLLLKEIEQKLLIVETVTFKVAVLNFRRTVSLSNPVMYIGLFDVSSFWQ